MPFTTQQPAPVAHWHFLCCDVTAPSLDGDPRPLCDPRCPACGECAPARLRTWIAGPAPHGHFCVECHRELPCRAWGCERAAVLVCDRCISLAVGSLG